MSPSQIQLWTSAAAAFDARHGLIEDQHLSLPTPCSDFDVAALVAHATETQITFGQVLGSTATEGMGWGEASAAMAAALEVDGCLDGSIEHQLFGETTKERMLAIATNDMLIHAWDLSQALSVDNTLPEVNLQAALDGIEAFPDRVRGLLFASPIPARLGASPQEQMLAAAGRQA